jgi:hypothetical protein
MKLFDLEPDFFESQEEAAVYFEHTVRNHLPQGEMADRVQAICVKKQLDADVSAICFTGIGQWFMKAIKWTDDNPEWNGRQAKAACLAEVPANAVAVVDVCLAANYPVRPNYTRYGAACFLDKDRNVLSMWIDHEEDMVSPSSPTHTARDWEFALWRFRVSLYFQGFAVGHLVLVHWGVANSMVVATRESFDPHHPLRELITPYLYGTITINKTAIVNLVSERGAVVRIGAIELNQTDAMIEKLANEYTYETFPQMLVSKGEFPPGMLDSMPMVEDGRKLWTVIHDHVHRYVGLHYSNEKPVAEDRDVVEFWEKAKTTSNSFMGGMPELSFDSLVDYITTCIFYFTAVHEILGNVNFMTMTPHDLNGRILRRDLYGDYEFQGSIQDWYRIMCVVTSTTLESVPMFISQQEKSAEHFRKMSDDRRVGSGVYLSPPVAALADCYDSFAIALKSLSSEIAAANAVREFPFGSFDPGRLEVSVSL